MLSPNQVFGTRLCYSGYEGAVDENDKFVSCHLNIYEPSYFVQNSINIVFWTSFLSIFAISTFIYLRVNLHEKHIQGKIERRKLRRGAVIPSNFHAFSFDEGNLKKDE